MAEPSKPFNLAGDLKNLASVFKIRRTKLLLYAFAAAFIASTAFFAFNPSASSSPWFSNVFTSSSVPYRSQIANLFSFVFPNSTAVNFPQTDAGSGESASKSDLAARNESGSGVGASTNGAASGLDASRSDLGAKNGTGSGIGVKSGGKDGILVKDQGKNGDVAVSLEKNVTKSSVSSVSSGGELSPATPLKNGTGSGGSSSGIQATAKKENVVAGKNESSQGNSAISKSDGTAKTEKKGDSAVSKSAESTKTEKKGNSAALNISETAKTEKKGNSTIPKSGETEKTKKKADSAVSKSSETEKKGDTAVSKNGDTGKIEKKGNSGGGKVSNFTILPVKQKGSVPSPAVARTVEDWIKGMKGCDLFDGKWVKDDSYPLYPEGSCPLIDEPFNCYLNGRPDLAYQKLRWKPNGCEIPRLNPIDMLERLRGKRLVFVGDSLNRNMWESLVCILRNAVKDKKKVFEASGRSEFRTVGSYSFIFKDYNCSVEYFRSPFLVQEWEIPVNKGSAKETLRLDLIEKSSPKYKNADVIVFNTGHWWTHEKTAKGKDYYQEGNHIYSDLNVLDAFHKALNTWAKWVDSNVNPKKTLVFFRGYSASHFSGGQWNSGGQCDRETEPITNDKYLTPYPSKMAVLESVIKGMKTPVSYMNITRMTDYRKDGHPSIYRKQKLTDEERKAPERYQDCSHWCMPGVPDSWNELLYAELLSKQHQIISGQ